MSNNKELWKYTNNEQVWVGKYQNSQNISHWHSDCELLYVYQGTLEVMCEKEEYTLKPGDTFFIESKKLHSMHASSKNTEIMIIVFDDAITRKFVGNLTLVSPLLTRDYQIPLIYQKLYHELTTKPAFYEVETKAIIESLAVKIYRNEKTIEKRKIKKIDERLKLLLDDINKNYQDYTCDKASVFMGMNKSYFSRFFHTNAGISFAKYLNCVKVENAVDLISSKKDYQMTDIASLCGFQTIRNFNLIMKEFTGYAPKDLPDNYVFNGLRFRDNDLANDPTSASSKLIEYSSPRR